MIDNLLWLNVNSTNKLSGESGNFIYNIQINSAISWKLTHVSITNVNIPKSYYMIQNDYNEFHISENNIMINITVPVGNYTRSQFFSKVSSLMTMASLNNIVYILSDLYSDRETGHLKIIASNNINNYELKLVFSDINDIHQAMGFLKESTNIFINDVIIWPYIINLNYANNIIMHWNCVFNDVNDTSTNDILCNIYCWSFQPFSYIWLYYDLLNNMKKLIIPTQFSFFFTNEDNELINFNNVELWFTINFFTYTPFEKLYKLIYAYWKIKMAEKL